LPLGLWDCTELAPFRGRADEVVKAISANTVRRILAANQLKPWRQRMWLSPKVPRDAAFAAAVRDVADLYTRPLATDEAVLCVDEKTSIQPFRGRGEPRRPLPPVLAKRCGWSTSTAGMAP